ncbi:hypothetical protein [Streptomyces blastmyceticus]|uniref:Adhesin domain-containing protein n=1 Tax=Streptomyces blastmyceticus TaxID=68180 RepID=A0ABN0WIW9_9ACTN
MNVEVLVPRTVAVDLRTSGGDVTETFTVTPDRAEGRTSGGDVKIHVPRDSYAVEASTSGGTRKVTVPTDDRSPRRITAHTQGGDVTVAS